MTTSFLKVLSVCSKNKRVGTVAKVPRDLQKFLQKLHSCSVDSTCRSEAAVPTEAKRGARTRPPGNPFEGEKAKPDRCSEGIVTVRSTSKAQPGGPEAWHHAQCLGRRSFRASILALSLLSLLQSVLASEFSKTLLR